MSIQLELIARSEIEIVREEIKKVKEEADNIRRGLFARHNELSRLFLDQQEQIKLLRENQCDQNQR